MLIVSPVTSVVALMDKGMVLEQIKIRKTFKAVCRRLNVLVGVVSLLFKVGAADWIINSLQMHQIFLLQRKRI